MATPSFSRRASLACVIVAGLLAQSSGFARAELPKASPKPALPPDLDAFVARTIREFEVPGLALAIVKDGQPILLKGYGVRRLGTAAPVTPQTLFGIASNTKAFTAAALAMLVDEGKLAWDDPVTRHLPAFQLYDPYVTRELTVRDLLTHRSGLGLGAGDLMFFPPSTFTRDEIVERLRYIKPATSFRSKYAYDNCLYLVAGQIVPALTGQSWDELIKSRIFAPLGMTTSNTSVSDLAPDGDVATPHSLVDKVVTPVAPHRLDNNAPAGGINSSIAEMSRWVLAQLEGGVYRDAQGNEKRLFSPAQNKEMWSAQTLLPIADPPKELAALRPRFAAYGLGWGLRDYRGRKLVSHTGGLLGMVSQVVLVPEERLGIVVLTNQEQGAAFRAVTWRILDHFLGAPPVDWLQAFKSASAREVAEAQEKVEKQAANRVRDSKPALPFASYCRRYRDAWYGEVEVAIEEGKPVIRFSRTPSLVGDLEHWQHETFVARWRDRSLNADAFVTFALGPHGGIEQMKMAPVSPLTDFSFDFQDLLFTPMAEAKSGAPN
jgi:CubicO group peptidase (beta-lactamase class C family)